MYKIIIDDSVKLFLEENNIKDSQYFKDTFKTIKVFPRSKKGI